MRLEREDWGKGIGGKNAGKDKGLLEIGRAHV